MYHINFKLLSKQHASNILQSCTPNSASYIRSSIKIYDIQDVATYIPSLSTMKTIVSIPSEMTASFGSIPTIYP